MRLWAPVVLYMGAIFFVSSLSDPPVPPTTDKPLHWLAYLGLAVLVVRALAGTIACVAWGIISRSSRNGL